MKSIFAVLLFFALEVFTAGIEESITLKEPGSKRQRRDDLSLVPTKVIDILPGVKFRYPTFLADGSKEPLSLDQFGKDFWVSPEEEIRKKANNGELITICGGFSYIYTRLAFDDEITPQNLLMYRGSPYRIHLAPKNHRAKIFLFSLFDKTLNVGLYLAKERSGQGWVGLGPDNVYSGSIDQWINSLILGLREDVEHSGRFTATDREKILDFELYDPKNWAPFAMLDSYPLSGPLTGEELAAFEGEQFPLQLIRMTEETREKLKEHIRLWINRANKLDFKPKSGGRP